MSIKSVSIRIEEEMLNKIAHIADYEGRSVNSQVLVLIRENPNYSGFVMFSYGDLTRQACREEMENFKRILRGTDNEKD